jgi:microcystin degradation protein MlrC
MSSFAPKLRIAVAELAQETDSFSPLRTGLDEFECYGLFRRSELLERMRGTGPIGGLLDAVTESTRDVDLVPLLRAWPRSTLRST